jgi:hypothetical protein
MTPAGRNRFLVWLDTPMLVRHEPSSSGADAQEARSPSSGDTLRLRTLASQGGVASAPPSHAGAVPVPSAEHGSFARTASGNTQRMQPASHAPPASFEEPPPPSRGRTGTDPMIRIAPTPLSALAPPDPAHAPAMTPDGTGTVVASEASSSASSASSYAAPPGAAEHAPGVALTMADFTSTVVREEERAPSPPTSGPSHDASSPTAATIAARRRTWIVAAAVAGLIALILAVVAIRAF